MPTRSKGIYLALVTALISGVSVFINKFAVAAFDSPILLPTIKNGLVGLLLVSVLVVTGKWQKVKALNKKQAGQLILIGIVGGSLPFYLFFTGLSQIPAINAALIHKSLVLWVALLAVPFLKEKFTKTQGIAVLLLFFGNLMIGGFKGFTYSKGELMVFLATLLWAGETILVKKVLRSVDSDLAATARMGLGSLFLLATSAITAPFDLTKMASMNSTQWFWIALTSLTLFGYVSSWYKALKFSSAISVSAVLVSATLITNLLSAIFITHNWNTTLTVQGILITVGTLLFGLSLRGKRVNVSTQLY